MKEFGKILITYICLELIFIGLLVLSCSFPTSLIRENSKKSSDILKKEGNRKICFIFEKFQYQMFDNYSDCLMINTAYSIDSKTPMFSAFTAKKDYIPGATKKIHKDGVGELSSSSKYKEHDEVSEFQDTVNGEAPESFEYARYWHGYLILLRPLLIFLDYQQIRILFTLIFAILAIYITAELVENKGKWVGIFFLLSLFFIEYFYIGISLINSITMLVAMIFSLIVVKKNSKIKDWNLFFFVIGMFVGFFTLLDIPLLTFGIPIILYFVYKDGDGKGNFKELVKYGILWLLGYSLTWLSKWILMDLIYNRDLIKAAIGQVFYRSVGGFSLELPLYSICINLLTMALPIILTLIISFFVVFIKYNKNISKDTRKKARIYLIIGLLPFVWYIVFSNHSANHYFFAYRLQFMSMFCFLLWIYYVCGEMKKT